MEGRLVVVTTLLCRVEVVVPTLPERLVVLTVPPLRVLTLVVREELPEFVEPERVVVTVECEPEVLGCDFTVVEVEVVERELCVKLLPYVRSLPVRVCVVVIFE